MSTAHSASVVVNKTLRHTDKDFEKYRSYVLADSICFSVIIHWRGTGGDLLENKLKIFIARQQRSMLMRDIDIAHLSVCPYVRLSVRPSVTFRYQMKTA